VVSAISPERLHEAAMTIKMNGGRSKGTVYDLFVFIAENRAILVGAQRVGTVRRRFTAAPYGSNEVFKQQAQRVGTDSWSTIHCCAPTEAGPGGQRSGFPS
jgi:hypothetical protein